MEISKSMAIFHEVWRHANRPDGMHFIQCKSVAEASRLRFALYNAVKPYRNGKREADQELKDAILNCSICLTEDKKGIIMQKKLDSDLAKVLLDAIGGGLPLTIEERMANNAYERIMKRGPMEPGDLDITHHLDGTVETKVLNYGARRRVE